MTYLKKLSLISVFLLLAQNNKNIICKQQVHVFGDSHAYASFIGSFPLPINIITLNGYTMHRIGRDGLEAIDLRKFNIQEEDFVVYVFGEIDVRNHIARQLYIHNRDLEEIIDTLVQNYIKTIALNQSFFHQVHSIVFCVVPPTNQGYNTFNFYGSLEDRILFNKKLNALLETELAKNNILFLNVYDHYATPEGILKSELSDKNVHISIYHNAFVREQLLSLIKNMVIPF